MNTNKIEAAIYDAELRLEDAYKRRTEILVEITIREEGLAALRTIRDDAKIPNDVPINPTGQATFHVRSSSETK